MELGFERKDLINMMDVLASNIQKLEKKDDKTGSPHARHKTTNSSKQEEERRRRELSSSEMQKCIALPTEPHRVCRASCEFDDSTIYWSSYSCCYTSDAILEHED
jgi:hypothetical protein